MSLFALPVTVDDILLLQDSIQFFTNQAQATSQAAAINAETSTVYDYAQQLLAANLATSQVAVAVPSLILNETPTVGVIENITLNFLPDQIDFAISQGLDPVVYAAEAWAVNVASSNAADFNALYGNLNSTQFAAVVSTTTGVNTDAILNFIANWQAFFSANPNAIPPNLNVTTASYAAAFGDAIGNALVDDSVFTEGVNAFAENALLTIATGQYLEGVPPGAIPQHLPLQGEDQGLRLTIGVDNLTTSLPGAVFDATPASNPPFGSDNTLNTGDTLVSTEGDAEINFTTAGGLGQFVSNPPFALGVNMDGIQTANILHSFPLLVPAGFSGVIEGLTNVNLVAGNIGDVQLGLPTLGLLSAVENITIDSVGPIVSALPDLELWMDDSAFDGTQEVNLVLNGVGALDEAEVDLEVVGGTVGYGAVNVVSNVSLNVLDLDTDSMDTIATVNAEGAADLTIFGSVLDQDTLELFDGSAMTGNIDATFAAGTGGVEAIGGDGDDVFTWLTTAGAGTTFTTADSVDGGAGDNRLRLQSDGGALLLAGVGASIVNIHVIEHFAPGALDTPLTVNMAESGSATVLDLAEGDYSDDNVTVENLLSTDTVIYSGGGTTGEQINILTLTHASPVGTIHLDLAATDAGPVQQIDELVVNTGLVVDVDSGGNADLNTILDVDTVNANIVVTGDVDLTLGTAATPYDFAGGIVDASTFTGVLTLFLGANSQQAIGGEGNDLIVVLGASATNHDLINLGAGGEDTVRFNEDISSGAAPTNANYHLVTSFDLDDQIELNLAGLLLEDTQAAAVTAATDPLIFEYANGGVATSANGSGYNIILADLGVTAGATADAGFDAVFGALGSLLTSAGADNILFGYYDNTNQQLVLGTADSFFGVLPVLPFFGQQVSPGSTFEVVSLVAMTSTEYQNLTAANFDFV